MREQPLLTAAPPFPVRSLAELYALAFQQARKATQHYDATAAQMDDRFLALRAVFATLAAHERNRVDNLVVACLAACGKRPDTSDLCWAPIELVPEAEIRAIRNSSLSTPYTAWAFAVSLRQRAFVFWTYIIAAAEDPIVRHVAEGFAHEALSDGNLLRLQRRIAWRAERGTASEDTAGDDEPTSAALLESLLIKDMAVLTQDIASAQRQQILTLEATPLPAAPTSSIVSEHNLVKLGFEEIEQVKLRALRRAEQLVNIYLGDADRATSESGMELAQKLASTSIIRLASLRELVLEPRRRRRANSALTTIAT